MPTPISFRQALSTLVILDAQKPSESEREQLKSALRARRPLLEQERNLLKRFLGGQFNPSAAFELPGFTGNAAVAALWDSLNVPHNRARFDAMVASGKSTESDRKYFRNLLGSFRQALSAVVILDARKPSEPEREQLKSALRARRPLLLQERNLLKRFFGRSFDPSEVFEVPGFTKGEAVAALWESLNVPSNRARFDAMVARGKSDEPDREYFRNVLAIAGSVTQIAAMYTSPGVARSAEKREGKKPVRSPAPEQAVQKTIMVSELLRYMRVDPASSRVEMLAPPSLKEAIVIFTGQGIAGTPFTAHAFYKELSAAARANKSFCSTLASAIEIAKSQPEFSAEVEQLVAAELLEHFALPASSSTQQRIIPIRSEVQIANSEDAITKAQRSMIAETVASTLSEDQRQDAKFFIMEWLEHSSTNFYLRPAYIEQHAHDFKQETNEQLRAQNRIKSGISSHLSREQKEQRSEARRISYVQSRLNVLSGDRTTWETAKRMLMAFRALESVQFPMPDDLFQRKLQELRGLAQSRPPRQRVPSLAL